MPDLDLATLPDLQAALADRYTIERELGRGGMATVYLARDARHARSVALKVLRPEVAAALGPERFLREIQIAAQFAHPHILPLHDSGAVGPFLYYVMPYVEGQSLRERLEREPQLPLAQAVQIAREVADALSYAHGHDVVHRDIKPDNILVAAGHAVVSDFGIARAITAAAGGKLTETGVVIGTPAYMSPEQASGAAALDGRSDVYSLGCVLYEMLVGEPPYTGPSAQIVIAKQLADPVPSVRRLRAAVPPALDAVVATALAKTPADRFATAAQFAEALAAPAAVTTPLRPARRGWPLRARPLGPLAMTLALGVALAAALGAGLFWRPGTRVALDPNLVAVAPFDVLAPNGELWREGLVDVVSRNLDGAGPLRSVMPTAVIRAWRGRADAGSARELGRRTGAQIVVIGALLAAGRDSVRLTASLVDAASGNALAEIEYRDAAARIDRLSDSLTVAVLRELGRTRPIGAVRFASLGSTSLPAMKAFLRGEQFYRRGEWDSAFAAYQRAVAFDSTFTLALRRLPLVLWSLPGWRQEPALMLREGAHNHGLAPRESLLVTVDSLWGALDAGETEPWPLLQRLFATLDQAVRRYPDDPEVWYHRGELGVHWGSYGRPPITPAQALSAFERSMALDSSFGAGCDHRITLLLVLRSPADARREISACLALGPSQAEAASLRLLDVLLDPTRGRSQEVGRLLDTLPADALSNAAFALLHFEDSAETQVRVARAFTAARHGYQWSDSAFMRTWGLALTLSYHGHLREAYRNVQLNGDMLADLTFAELALLGGIPRDVAAATFGRWLREGRFKNDLAGYWSGEVIEGALGWWAHAGDTGSIGALARRVDSWISAAANAGQRALLRYAAAAAPAYLALARRDTAEALRGFALVPDSLCVRCYLERLTRIRLLASTGQNEEAARLLDERTHTLGEYLPSEVSWALERARVNERLGNRDKAAGNYAFVARVWAHADSSLQPLVAEARAALPRLGGEPRSVAGN